VVQTAADIVRMLLLTKTRPIGVICLGDPYIADEFIGTAPEFVLRSFSDSAPSIRMTLELLKENI
jgi:hypothetical protein